MNRVAAISAGICSATLLLACAIDIGPFFKPGESPENETAFRSGQLGLITPALNRADELIAFRYLSGLALDDVDAMNAGLRPSVMNAGNERKCDGGPVTCSKSWWASGP